MLILSKSFNLIPLGPVRVITLDLPATQDRFDEWKVKVAQSCPTLCNPVDCSPWNSPGRNTEVGSCSLLQVIFPTQGLNPGLPTLQADSSPAEPPGKPKNTGVGSLSLLQWIFPTQEWNQGLLHCRWILYQLSYQGSPDERAKEIMMWVKSLGNSKSLEDLRS